MVQAHSGQQREVSFDISYSLLSLARSRSEPMYRTNGEAAAYGTGQQEQFNKRPEWVRDSAAPKCAQCSCSFTFWRRRHHCRACGHVFCDACSTNRITIPRLNYTTSEVRVCDHCWVREAELRYRKTSSSSSSSAPRSPTFAQLFAPLPAVHSTARQRHQRPLSLSKTSEVQINKSLLKRSLRNAATADEPTSGAVQISGVERSKEKEEETAPPRQPDSADLLGGHLRADAGELFHLFFKHNLKADIGFTLREFEKKRGTTPQKTLENAHEVLQLAHKSHTNSQQIFDRCSASVSTVATDCCQLIKSQLSRHTTYQEDRIQAAAVREDRRDKDKARFDQFYEEERQRVDAEFSELILTLDELYTAKFQYVPSEENGRHSDERLKEIRREVLLQQLAIVQKRRADRKAKRRLAKERKAALLATKQKEEEEEAKKAEESQRVEAESAPSAASASNQTVTIAEEETTTSSPPRETEKAEELQPTEEGEEAQAKEANGGQEENLPPPGI